jgi:hypothetical protein
MSCFPSEADADSAGDAGRAIARDETQQSPDAAASARRTAGSDAATAIARQRPYDGEHCSRGPCPMSTRNSTYYVPTSSATRSCPVPRHSDTTHPRRVPLASLSRIFSSLLILTLEPTSLACRRPASGQPLSRLGCPAVCLAGREPKSRPEAGRRHVRFLRRTPRDEHPETNTKRRTRSDR